MRGTRLAIVTHPRDSVLGSGYLVSALVPLWRDAGVEVVVVDDPGGFVPADAALLHVDLTVVPDGYRELAGSYPVVINGRATDISKRHVSRNLVRADDAWAGPVIVKTDRNFGGAPERSRLGSPLGRRARGALRRYLPGPLGRAAVPTSYRIFASKDEVPRTVWLDRRLVVERFLPEREGERYFLRIWVFLGDREFTLRLEGTDPIVKAGSAVDYEVGVEVPPRIRALRRELGFDYGKFDFGLHEGRPVLYDANRTPTIARRSGSSDGEERLERLAGGLRGFVSK